MTVDLAARAREIHDRLIAGETPFVAVDVAEPVIAWGVAGLTLECPAEGARELAAVFAAEGYMPGLAELLRSAAALCDAHSNRTAANDGGPTPEP